MKKTINIKEGDFKELIKEALNKVINEDNIQNILMFNKDGGKYYISYNEYKSLSESEKEKRNNILESKRKKINEMLGELGFERPIDFFSYLSKLADLTGKKESVGEFIDAFTDLWQAPKL